MANAGWLLQTNSRTFDPPSVIDPVANLNLVGELYEARKKDASFARIRPLSTALLALINKVPGA